VTWKPIPSHCCEIALSCALQIVCGKELLLPHFCVPSCTILMDLTYLLGLLRVPLVQRHSLCIYISCLSLCNIHATLPTSTLATLKLIRKTFTPTRNTCPPQDENATGVRDRSSLSVCLARNTTIATTTKKRSCGTLSGAATVLLREARYVSRQKKGRKKQPTQR
jgi:hypothetical protein